MAADGAYSSRLPPGPSAPNFLRGFRMPSGDDVQALRNLGYSWGAPITAHAGGGFGGATGLIYTINSIGTCEADGDSVKLPQAIPGLGLIVKNTTGHAAQVFAFTASDTIDGNPGDVGISLTGGSKLFFQCADDGDWYSSGTISSALDFTGEVTGSGVGTIGLTITPLAVSTGKIADDAVTEGKLADLAVTEGKIGDEAVTTPKIADLAIATGKLADQAVTYPKIVNMATDHFLARHTAADGSVESLAADVAAGLLGLFATRVAAAAARIPSVVDYVRTAGYASVTDGGGALYVPTGGSTPGGFQSADGQWWELIGSIVKPEQFGAKGDGATNDTTAFVDANSYLDANDGGILAIGSKTYVITQTLLLPTGATYQGVGNASVLKFPNTTTRISANRVIGLLNDGTPSGNATGGAAVNSDISVLNLTVDCSAVIDSAVQPIRFNDSQRTRVEGCYIKSRSQGILNVHTADYHVVNNTIEVTNVAGGDDSTVIDQWWGSHDFVISGNVIISGSSYGITLTGLQSDGVTLATMYNGEVVNNIVNGVTKVGVLMNGAHHNHNIDGNLIEGVTAGNGIQVSPATVDITQLVISNNQIKTIFHAGVYLFSSGGGALDDVVIEGNLIVDVNTAASSAADTGSGIYDGSGSDHVIQGNRIKGTTHYRAVASVSSSLSLMGNAADAGTNGVANTFTATGTNAYRFGNSVGANKFVDGITQLNGARTYYVRTNGSDTNDGLANTAGGAFLTIQKAVDTIRNHLDLNGQVVTISVQAGTYTDGVDISGPWTGKGTVAIVGDTATPTNVVISTTSDDCFNVDNAAYVTIHGFKLTTATSGSGIQVTGSARVDFGQINFGACATHHLNMGNGATAYADAAYTVSGGAVDHWHLGGPGFFATLGAFQITLTGTPAFSGAWAATAGGFMQITSGVTFSGSATGLRYFVWKNGVIDTGGSGETYLPGNAAGSYSLGGIYDHPGYPFILARSGAAVSHTGDTNETTLATISIAAKAMGTNGALRVTTIWSMTNNANAKTARLKFAGGTISSAALASGASYAEQRVIMNQNSASAQVAYNGAGGYGLLTAAVVTGAVDTTTAHNLTITIELGNGGDTVTLEAYIVELLYGQ